MRRINRIFCLAALLDATPARADVTLVYGEGSNTSGEAPAAAHQVMIRGSKLAIANALDKRLLIYDAAANTVTVVDHAEKRKAVMDRDGVAKIAARYLETQRLALAEIEKKMVSLPKEDREGLRPTLEMLQTAVNSPEKLEAVPYRLEAAGHSETFLGMKAEGAWLLQGDEKVAQTLLASAEAAGLSEVESGVLQGLSAYLERLAKGLPAAVRSLMGLRGMVAPDARLVLKSVPEASGEARVELLSIRRDALEAGWFAVSEDYEMTTLEIMSGLVKGPEKPAAKTNEP